MTQTATQPDQALQEVLAAVRNYPSAESEPPECSDYDWNSPSRFTISQLDELAGFAARAARSLSSCLARQLGQEIELQPATPSQHYAKQLLTAESETPEYFIDLLDSDRTQCGLVVVPSLRGLTWVATILRSPAVTEPRELSELEASLLEDVVDGTVSALSGVLEQVGAGPLHCGREMTAKPELSDAAAADDYVQFTFRPSEDEGAEVISFFLSVRTVAAAAGIDTTPSDRKSPQKVRKDLKECLENTFVDAKAVVGGADLSLREVVSLEVGDVLLIDKDASEPVDLTVEGTALLAGAMVNSEGRYALQILGAVGTKAAGARK